VISRAEQPETIGRILSMLMETHSAKAAE